MIQDVRFGGPEPRGNFVFRPNFAPAGGDNQFVPPSFNPFESSLESGQHSQVFPRNSWQSPEAQMEALLRGQESLQRPGNFRRHPGFDLFGPGELHHHHHHHHHQHDSTFQPVYGSPNNGEPPVYQPVYGSPNNGDNPVAQPVYGAPIQPEQPMAPVYGGPINQDPIFQPVYGGPVHPQAPVYGGPFQH